MSPNPNQTAALAVATLLASHLTTALADLGAVGCEAEAEAEAAEALREACEAFLEACQA